MVTQIQTTWNEYKMNWKQKELINCSLNRETFFYKHS